MSGPGPELSKESGGRVASPQTVGEQLSQDGEEVDVVSPIPGRKPPAPTFPQREPKLPPHLQSGAGCQDTALDRGSGGSWPTSRTARHQKQ